LPGVGKRQAAAHGIVEHEGNAVGREDRERQSRAIRHDHIRPPDQSGPLGGEDVGAVHLSQKRRRPRVEIEIRQQSERIRIERRAGIAGRGHAREMSRGEQVREPGPGEAGGRQIARLSARLVEGGIGHARHCLTGESTSPQSRGPTAATAAAEVMTGKISNSITSAHRAVHSRSSSGSSHSMI